MRRNRAWDQIAYAVRQRRMKTQDAHWITVRYGGICCRCGWPVEPGSRAIYFPDTKELW